MTSDWFQYPFDKVDFSTKKYEIRQELRSRLASLSDKTHPYKRRIAILGGSSTAEIRDILELFLLNEGIEPTFYECEYSRFYESVAFNDTALENFSPEIVYIHTSHFDILSPPRPFDSVEQVTLKLRSELDRFRVIWDKLRADYQCEIIQNNFDLPQDRTMGNLEGWDHRGLVHFISKLNLLWAEEANQRSGQGFYINDIHYLAARLGLDRWYDRALWYGTKYAVSFEAMPFLAHSISKIIGAARGKTKKGIVLDLDNTLWGGAIGEDGAENIKIGKEDPLSEAYRDFQVYIRSLRERGILLSVCSKNEIDTAKTGFRRSSSILRESDFAAFRASWEPKDVSILDIIQQLDLSPNSLVFVDDNAVERELIRKQIPEIAVPNVGAEVENFPSFLDRNGYFEIISLSDEDLNRNEMYHQNAERNSIQSSFRTYGDFLASLDMEANITAFPEPLLKRITQLVNKTNQFNLTNLRYTESEMRSMTADPAYLTIAGSLKDRFGDNGLVAVTLAELRANQVWIKLWLMSCRVLKREMELAMFDSLIHILAKTNAKEILGTYHPTGKNQLVRDFYGSLGFKQIRQEEDGSVLWAYAIPSNYTQRNRHIRLARS